MKIFIKQVSMLCLGVFLLSGRNANAQMVVDTFKLTNSIVSFKVPNGVNQITITAIGATGGKFIGNTPVGGNGAKLTGTFTVTPDSTLKILVGGAGQDGSGGGGGGGGSFVTDIQNNPLIIAGGGGGVAGDNSFTSIRIDATAADSGLTGNSQLGNSPSQYGIGGRNGNGATNAVAGGPCGGNGGGLLTDGQSYSCCSLTTGGMAFVNGGAGGIDGGCFNDGQGGFGGGGSGGNTGGGGGGGYSGGGGSWDFPTNGAGAGSFNGGSSQTNVDAFNASGDGMVIMTYSVVYAQADTFGFTGAQQTWVVPCGVNSVSVDMAGAQGGFNNIPGGLGGRVECTYNTSPGTVFNLFVGGQGGAAASQAPGGFNGGGNAGISNGGSFGSGGGGATDIRVGGITFADRVIVAGGGGGVNNDNPTPGAGGDTIGGKSNGCCNSCFATWATGGTQNAGGLDAVGSGSCCIFTPTPDGSFGVGADGAGPSASCNNGDGGAGGGGGYFGGGGGGGYGSGAGGSSYTDLNSSNVTHTQGYQSGDGYIIIHYNKFTVTGNAIAQQSSGCNGSVSAILSNGSAPYTYMWTGGATTDTASNLCAGTYCVKVTDNNGCMDSACVTINDITGIKKISNAASISIYPDPTKGYFTVSGVAKGQVVKVYNYLGEEISSMVADNADMRYDITNKPNGIYLVKIQNSNGKLITEKKIIKAQ